MKKSKRIFAITDLLLIILIKGYISHQEAISLQKQSQVLLLIEIDSEETQGIIAGKLFEYMISGRPILAIGPHNWDVTPILTETQTGTFVGYTDASQMKAKITRVLSSISAQNT